MFMVNFQCPWPHIISINILNIYKADAVCTQEIFGTSTSFFTSIVSAACSRSYRSNIYMYQTINEETKITRIPTMTIHTTLVYRYNR